MPRHFLQNESAPLSGATCEVSSSDLPGQRVSNVVRWHVVITRPLRSLYDMLQGDYIAIMIIEMLATKVAMEAKAAISRRRSVIVVSRVLLCF
jgi:hypothetical protein